MVNLQQAALEIATRLSRLFTKDEQGRRACYGGDSRFESDPNWREYIQFHEYFQGDTGRGLGASHQTGWTALITRCVNMVARVRED